MMTETVLPISVGYSSANLGNYSNYAVAPFGNKDQFLQAAQLLLARGTARPLRAEPLHSGCCGGKLFAGLACAASKWTSRLGVRQKHRLGQRSGNRGGFESLQKASDCLVDMPASVMKHFQHDS